MLAEDRGRPHRGLPHRPRLAAAARPLGGGEGADGGPVIVVTEIPYQVQKAKLIERLAELLAERKLPFLADIRDEFDRRSCGSC